MKKNTNFYTSIAQDRDSRFGERGLLLKLHILA